MKDVSNVIFELSKQFTNKSRSEMISDTLAFVSVMDLDLSENQKGMLSIIIVDFALSQFDTLKSDVEAVSNKDIDKLIAVFGQTFLSQVLIAEKLFRDKRIKKWTVSPEGLRVETGQI